MPTGSSAPAAAASEYVCGLWASTLTSKPLSYPYPARAARVFSGKQQKVCYYVAVLPGRVKFYRGGPAWPSFPAEFRRNLSLHCDHGLPGSPFASPGSKFNFNQAANPTSLDDEYQHTPVAGRIAMLRTPASLLSVRLRRVKLRRSCLDEPTPATADRRQKFALGAEQQLSCSMDARHSRFGTVH